MFPAKSFRQWWGTDVVGTVDHRSVIDHVCAESGWSAHFAFMTLMSAGIAVLGLLLSSPAVVIGAMLLAPLMGPIIGLGFGLATFDSRELRRSGIAIGMGIVLAVGFCAFVTVLSPLQQVTDEIASRTRPNLFDLLVALFSGLAAAYAMVRGRHGAIVGVAIATALMPPLAVMGFGLATLNWTVLGGSSLLFFTNLMTIGIAAAGVARIYGFGHTLSPRQTGLQATLIVVIFIALAVPLGLALRQIAWETLASRQAREVVASAFQGEARISRLAIDYDSMPIEVEAEVFTSRYRPGAEAAAERDLTRIMRRPVTLKLEQFRAAAEEAEAAEIAAARGAAADRTGAEVAERLALAAGVPVDRVLVDRVRQRAEVRAAALPGAPLATYRALETRIAALEPRWQVSLIPPLEAELPVIGYEEGEPDVEAIATAVWAAQRLGLPLSVRAASEERAEEIAEALRAAGIDAEVSEAEGPQDGNVALSWRTPS